MLAGALGPALVERKLAAGELTITVAPAASGDVMAHLRDDPDCEFKILVDICGNDWPQRAKRFDVVYHLLVADPEHAHPGQGDGGGGRGGPPR